MTFDEWFERYNPHHPPLPDGDFARIVWAAAVAAERERCQAIVRPYHNGASSAPEVYDAAGDIAREIESGLPSRWYRDDAGNWNYRNHGGPTDAEQGEDQAVTGQDPSGTGGVTET